MRLTAAFAVEVDLGSQYLILTSSTLLLLLLLLIMYLSRVIRNILHILRISPYISLFEFEILLFLGLFQIIILIIGVKQIIKFRMQNI